MPGRTPESVDDLLNPHRDEEIEKATSAAADRLRMRNVQVDGTETPEETVALLEAVERFELAVQSHGGDLMVDEPPPGHAAEPDDPLFVIPARGAGERAATYVERIDAATVRIHQMGVTSTLHDDDAR